MLKKLWLLLMIISILCAKWINVYAADDLSNLDNIGDETLDITGNNINNDTGVTDNNIDDLGDDTDVSESKKVDNATASAKVVKNDKTSKTTKKNTDNNENGEDTNNNTIEQTTGTDDIEIEVDNTNNKENSIETGMNEQTNDEKELIAAGKNINNDVDFKIVKLGDKEKNKYLKDKENNTDIYVFKYIIKNSLLTKTVNGNKQDVNPIVSINDSLYKLVNNQPKKVDNISTLVDELWLKGKSNLKDIVVNDLKNVKLVNVEIASNLDGTEKPLKWKVELYPNNDENNNSISVESLKENPVSLLNNTVMVTLTNGIGYGDLVVKFYVKKTKSLEDTQDELLNDNMDIYTWTDYLADLEKLAKNDILYSAVTVSKELGDTNSIKIYPLWKDYETKTQAITKPKVKETVTQVKKTKTGVEDYLLLALLSIILIMGLNRKIKA